MVKAKKIGKDISKTLVYVGISGGVDSAVAAALLLQQGYQVVGVFMKNWSTESFGGTFSGACPWEKDLAEARQVCQKLKIPLKVYNFEQEYDKQVLRYFFKEEQAGRTPNPDIMCNREIKFGLFLNQAVSEGADFIATGHYVKKKVESCKSKIARKKLIRYQLVIPKDQHKDQSYFLCLLKQPQLAKALFPLGDLTKPEVRQLAKKFGLANANRPDSMGICFVGEVKIIDFIKARIKETPGQIITTNGKIIGVHQGLPFYTIGQRQGLNLGGGGPYYVVAKNKRKNQLVVAVGDQDPALYTKKIKITKVSWQQGVPPKFPLVCQVRLRHQQPLQQARIIKQHSKLVVLFTKPQRAATPGQFCVIYKNKKLLGGGVIV
ncbi:MAG: tRNA 2-thiouridine(34) synthase MnmA [Candidatus Buchananbacteria bacterium]